MAFSRNKLLHIRAGGRKAILNIIDNIALSDSEISLRSTETLTLQLRAYWTEHYNDLTSVHWESLTTNAQLQGRKYSSITLLKDYSIQKENENKNSFLRTLLNCTTTGRRGHQPMRGKAHMSESNSPPASYPTTGNRHPHLNNAQLLTSKQEEKCSQGIVKKRNGGFL